MKPKTLKRNWITVPVAALILANVIPVWGVLFLSWDAFNIVLLYWAENLAVGFYNILKIAFAQGPKQTKLYDKIAIMIFFTAHYGGFTLIHGLGVLSIFKKISTDIDFKQIYMLITPAVMVGLFALFISHGVSFVYHYFYKREFVSADAQFLMIQPYGELFLCI